MRLPTQLSRRNNEAHKNDFGHILILAGSGGMLGAAALSGLSAMRMGAGLVTIAVPKSLNSILQKKISNVIMTLALPETAAQTISFKAFKEIEKVLSRYDVVVIGPGLTINPSTKKFILKIIEKSPVPLVIDADALNSLQGNLNVLLKSKSPKVLTPHLKEMSRLTKYSKEFIVKNRSRVAKEFALKFRCVVLLKGYRTVVASGRNIYINKTGNSGMATAGSGDVLDGIIAGLIAQKVDAFNSAKFGAYIHGLAGDMAANKKTKVSLIAADIIDFISCSLKKLF